MKSVTALFALLLLLSTETPASSWRFVTPPDDPKIASTLQQGLPGERFTIWVFFTDKGITTEKEYTQAIADPRALLSERALRRRAKVRPDDNLVDFRDLPVPREYVEAVFEKSIRRRTITRWFNAVSIEVMWEELHAIAKLPFVRRIQPVARGTRPLPPDSEPNEPSESGENTGERSLNYGPSWTQNEISNVPAVHALGFSGQGVLICALDTGFSHDQHEAVAPIDVLSEWDFIDDDGNTDGPDNIPSHGTAVLSICAGFKDGEQIGPAYGAEFILARTEDVSDEYPQEEDFWQAGVEWADSAGADLITSSLAYIDWYQYEDLDGNTAVTTIAADWAAANGILVCNAMGNSGPSSGSLAAPADADSIVAVGSVNGSGIIAFSSSRGPTFDGRIKPEVVAMGDGNYFAIAGTENGYATGSGTSFATPMVSGIAALVLENHPTWDPMHVREALMMTASQPESPDNTYGHGIVDAMQAVFYMSIGGQVTDIVTGDPVTNASIAFVGPDSGVVFTDSTGRFLMETLDPGSYDITVSARGYYPKTRGYDVPPWRGDADFALIPSGTEIAVLEITAILIDDSGDELTDGDGDGQADVNETVAIDVVFYNDGNRAVDNAVLTVETTSPFLEVISGDSELATIAVGESTLAEGVALLSILPTTPHLTMANLTLAVSADNGYEETFVLELLLSAEMPHWPLVLSLAAGAPKVIDLDGDGDMEILFGDASGLFHVVHHDGTPLPGWPIALGDTMASLSTPAVVDIDGDEEYEILAVSPASLFCWHLDGTDLAGWPTAIEFDEQTAVFMSPMVADLDADGDEEVVLGTVPGQLHIWDHTGSLTQTLDAGEPMLCVPAIGDVDGDGTLEIIAGSGDPNEGTGGHVHAWHHDGSVVDGQWPRTIAGIMLGGIALADLDGDRDVEILAPGSYLIGMPTAMLYVFQGDGSSYAGWPQYMGFVIACQPTIGDMNLDGVLEFVVPVWDDQASSTVYAWTEDGVPVAGWPQDVDGVADFVAPMIGDIDGDGSPDVMIATTEGEVCAWGATGQPVAGFPYLMDEVFSTTGIVTINDLDGDGDVEIMLPNICGALHAWDLPGTFDPHSAMPWGMPRHDYRNTSNLATSLAPAPVGERGDGLPTVYRLWQNFPNPALAATTIPFDLPQASRVSLSIYDLTGRRVRSLLHATELAPGSHKISWDGTDDNGDHMGSGLFLCRLESAGYRSTRRLVIIR